jgi:hypothetical protein
MVNIEELIGTTEYLTLYTRCRINRCRYNRVRHYLAMYNLVSQKISWTDFSNEVILIA